MRLRIVYVRETDKVDSHMAKDVLVVEGTAYGLTDLCQVNLRQTGLRSEATNVDHFDTAEFVIGSDQPDETIWLDKE